MSRVRMSDLTKLNKSDLQSKIRESRGELAKLRVVSTKGTLKKNSGKLRPLRRDIARMETRLSELKVQEFIRTTTQNTGSEAD